MKVIIHFFFLLCLPFLGKAQLSFSPSNTQGCVPLAVNFSNQSQGYQSYRWDFGDGGTSVLKNPQYLYTQAGTYPVRLVGIGVNNDTIIRQGLISVHPKPQVRFTVQNIEQCLGSDSVNFINQSDSALQFQWSIGDGGLYQDYSFSHRYSIAGSYPITLIATSSAGCTASKTYSQTVEIRPKPTADFTASDTILCGIGSQVIFTADEVQALEYRWDFGNGQIDSTQAKQSSIVYGSAGSYSPRLNLVDSFGCESSMTKKDFIAVSDTNNWLKPLSNAYCSNTAIPFRLDSAVSSASWDFGDGSYSTQTNVEHHYSQAGFYAPKVQLVDSLNCGRIIKLDSIQIDQAPLINLKNNPLIDCVPYRLQIDLDHFYTNQFHWQLGSQQSNQAEPLFELKKAAKYDLQLITSNQYCSDTLKLDEFVSLQGGQQQLLTNDSISCAPFAVEIRSVDSTLVDYQWYSGDGDSANTRIFRHTYHQAGTYHPYLISKSASNCVDTTVFNSGIVVEDALVVFQQADTLVLCEPGPVAFNGNAMGGNYWKWSFGDGDSSSQTNPVHVYREPGIYQVSLITENTYGCYNHYAPYNIVKVKSGKADFSAIRKNCPNYTVKLYDNSLAATKWWWSFGDGTIDTLRNPVHSYPAPGFYQIKLKVWDRDGCIAEKVIPDFEISVCQGSDSIPLSNLPGFSDSTSLFTDSSFTLQGCLPMQLQFYLPRDTALQHIWDFGDGGVSYEANPEHKYDQPGIYTVSLIYQNLDQSYDTIVNQDFIEVRSPNAEFSYQIDNFCDSSTLRFSAQKKGAFQYLWNLGSAGIAGEEDVNKIYHRSINELISLTVIDSLLCSSTIYKNIATGNPNPFMSYEAYNCLGEKVKLSHNYQFYDSTVWRIDGRTFIGDTIEFQTIDTGKFKIDLQIFDQNACVDSFPNSVYLTVSDPEANFNGFQSGVHCGAYRVNFNNLSSGAVSYYWSFGDGDSSSQNNPTHLYDSSGSYYPILKASKDGCHDVHQSQQAIQLNITDVDFSVQQQSDCLPIQASFTAKAPQAVSYKWYFGDGDSSSLANPTHTYIAFPQSAVRLEIIDTNACRGVKEKAVIESFQSRAQANRWSGCEPLMVQFTDSSTNAVEWFWDFGDGRSSNKRNPKHTYRDSGDYSLQLISRSLNGCYDTLFLSEAIHVGKVLADFSVIGEKAACAPHLVSFDNHSLGASVYEWRFEDNGQSTYRHPNQIFSKAGIFDVTLFASDGKGCVDTLIKKNLMNINTPEVAFTLSDSIFCGPKTIEFTDHSKRLASRQWYFGDGSTSQNQKVSHTYDHADTLTVSLIVEDTAGCRETLNKEIEHRLKPRAKFTVDTLAICSPAGIRFYNQSDRTDQPGYNWSLNYQLYPGNGSDTVFQFLGSAVYDLGLIVENQNQCRDSFYFDQPLRTYASVEPEMLHFSEVSREIGGGVHLEWQTDSVFEFNFYQLYHKDETGYYRPLTRIYDWQIDQYRLSAAEAHDGINCFKIERVNHCVAAKGADSLLEFCSIELTASTHAQGIKLEWTPYKNQASMIYQLWRSAKNKQQYEHLAYLNDAAVSYIDSTAFCPEDYSYRISSNYVITQKSYRSYSDTANTYPGGRILQADLIDIKRATVVNDEHILLEWEQTGEMQKLINGYYLYRSKLRSGSEIIVHLPNTAVSYFDKHVDVENRSYQYQLQMDHNCSVLLDKSSLASSILLRKEENGELQLLKWNQPKGLKGGVKEYVIQKLDEFGNWVEVDRLGPEELEYLINKEQ